MIGLSERKYLGNSVLVFLLSCSLTFAERSTVSLNGQWELTKGGIEIPSHVFEGVVPVPGFVDLATQVTTTGEWWWYQKLFTVEQSAAKDVLLKLHKAKYGKYVYLNGVLVGSHQGNFTASYFDLTEHILFGQPNTLTIRVGEKGQSDNQGAVQGDDGEKRVYNVGIYDAVELQLFNNPRIERVQVNPKASGKVEVSVTLQSTIPTPYDDMLLIYLYKKGVAEAIGGSAIEVSIEAEGSTIISTEMNITDVEYWSPENPTLYEIHTQTAGDSQVDIFGFRTFRFNPDTHFPELNGVRYPLLGTNLCINRFYEDPDRGTLPWDSTWVRTLAQKIKSMHWNSVRFHVGFAPDFWYSIFDEEGILIQDEFNIWTGPLYDIAQTSEQLSAELIDWVNERANHPSVIIWDVTNESNSPKATEAISVARTYDIQNRPWENSFQGQHSSGDPMEIHPYLFLGDNFPFELSGLDSLQDGHKHNLGWNAYNYKGDDAPIINNEYGWLWINRDGSPTELTKENYEYLLGGGVYGTEEQRRYTYATYIAALTEYWRESRMFDGIQHFTVLTYSKPGVGQTSDNFLNPIADLTFDPYFEQYVKDAFAPVGICINHYASQYQGGDGYTFSVSIFNDTPENASGNVRFKLASGAITINKNEVLIYRSIVDSISVEPFEKKSVQFTLGLPTMGGSYSLIAEYYNGSQWIQSIRDIEIVPGNEIISFNKPAFSSSVREENVPSFGNDGGDSTRWESEHGSEDEWYYVDLEQVYSFKKIELDWEKAYPKEYGIEVSNDGLIWREVYRDTVVDGGKDSFDMGTVFGQYVKVHVYGRNGEYGQSFYEMRVFDTLAEFSDSIFSTGTVQKSSTDETLSSSLQISHGSSALSVASSESDIGNSSAMSPLFVEGVNSLGMHRSVLFVKNFKNDFSISVPETAKYYSLYTVLGAVVFENRMLKNLTITVSEEISAGVYVIWYGE